MDVKVDESVHLHCPLGCFYMGKVMQLAVVQLHLINEDEAEVQWAGVCPRCGREFHLLFPKRKATS